MTFNIKKIALVDSAIITLRDPDTQADLYADDEQTKPLTIEVYGRTSKQYKKLVESLHRKNNAQRKTKEKSLDEMAEDNAEFLASLTIKVSNFDYDGEEIVGKEMFKKVYLDPSLAWINEQVSEALNDNGNFLQK